MIYIDRQLICTELYSTVLNVIVATAIMYGPSQYYKVYSHTVEIIGQIARDLARTSRKVCL